MLGRLAAAVVSGTFAAIVLAGGPRRGPNQFLGAFLLLIAGNLAADAMVLHLGNAGDFRAELAWARLARLFAALDPLALFYFASIYPERNSLNRTPAVAAVGLGALLFASSAFWGVAPAVAAGDHTFMYAVAQALQAYTALVYLAVFVAVLRTLLRGRGNPATAHLYAALCFATFPKGAAALTFPLPDPGRTLATLLVPAGIAAVIIALARRSSALPAATRHGVERTTVGAVVMLIALSPSHVALLLESAGLAPPGTSAWVGAAFVSNFMQPTRWLLFGAFVSMAVLKHEMLGMSLAVRRTAARVVVAVAFLSAAGVLLLAADAMAGGPGLGVTPLNVALAGAALVASQGFRSLVDRVAARMYGVPMPGDLAASLEAYRSAAGEAAARGYALGEDPRLARLRQELGLDASATAVLDRMVSTAQAGHVVLGQSVAGRYRILRLLGRGGAGNAFLARDELLGRDVVIKEVLEDPSGRAGAALREAQMARDLDHPNVVRLLDVLPRPGEALLVTEFVAGGSLADRLGREGLLSLEHGLELIDDVLAGVQAIHARAIVHRDIKPSNILLGANGEAKVGDFGIARRAGEATVGPGGTAGTPGYMAPEVMRGGEATDRSDIYAVGRLLVRSIRGPLPAPVARVARRALANRPSQRWASAEAMRQALASARPFAARPAQR